MTLADTNITVVGAGNMAEALVRGLLKKKIVDASQIRVSDPRSERITDFLETYGVRGSSDNNEVTSGAEIIILAVKPQILDKVVDELPAASGPGPLIISIAAGVTLEQIRSHLKGPARLCRCMPNICAVVGEAATAFSPGHGLSQEDLDDVRAILESAGAVVQVDESLMDAVTGLSGSGPAYVFLMIEALSDAGVKVGIPRYHAQALAAQTVLGSAKLLIESKQHPGVLKDQVTSPGGTAIAGLHTLEEGGMRTTLINAVVAATQRAHELGETAGTTG